MEKDTNIVISVVNYDVAVDFIRHLPKNDIGRAFKTKFI
jgi:hypothetical protein